MSVNKEHIYDTISSLYEMSTVWNKFPQTETKGTVSCSTCMYLYGYI